MKPLLIPLAALLLAIALVLEVVPSKLPAKPFETAGLLAFVAAAL